MKTRGFEICKGYEDKNITLPKRGTKHSVGYDIFAFEDITIPSIWKSIFKNFKTYIVCRKTNHNILYIIIFFGNNINKKIGGYYGKRTIYFKHCK